MELLWGILIGVGFLLLLVLFMMAAVQFAKAAQPPRSTPGTLHTHVETKTVREKQVDAAVEESNYWLERIAEIEFEQEQEETESY